MKPLQLRVPELVPGLDVRTLPLSAIEGFVLSRIDGRCTVSEIVAVTGLGVEQVESIIEKLITLGAARWMGEARPPYMPVSSAITASNLPPSRPPSSPSQTPVATFRRRNINSAPPRRLLAESAISQAPPDFRPSQRPSTGSTPPRVDARANQGAGSQSEPPKTEPRVDPVRQLFEAVEESDRTAHRAERQGGRPIEYRAPNEAIPPGPSSQPDLMAEMLDVDLPYDPTELMEQVDLPFARRKEVLDLFYRLEQLDHYELLGIAYDADKKDVRAAYFGLSKVFHPDTMFRKNLGSYKAKMEVVFRQLTEAYETLGKKKSRDEYDRYLQATKKIQMAERALTFEAKRQQARSEAQPQPSQPAPVVTSQPQAPSEPAAPPREITDEARRLAQQIMQRRLRGVVGKPSVGERTAVVSMAPPPRADTPEPAPATRTDPQELLRRLTRTLKDVGAVTGTSDQLTRHVKASQNAFVRGDLAEATKQMQRALSIAPDREDLRAEHDRLSRMLSEKLATDYEEQAKFETKNGKWASAALSWSKVCEGRPRDALAHRLAAHALLKAGGDLRGAQKYAQQAVFLAPEDIEAHLQLAQLYLTIGLKLNAKRELDLASKLDPENEMVKNLLADMKT